MSSLVYRHSRITRLTHWINGLALLILFMSGLQIFNAFPHLHWGSKAEPDQAFLSIYATDEDGQVRGYTQIYGLRVETTGFFGIQNTEMGPSARAFPSWLTIPGFFWLAGGRRWHFFFAWVFVLNGLLYVIYNLLTGHLRKFFFAPGDAKKLIPMILYYLHLRRESPQDGEYNPLQKMAYTSVLLILVPLILLSGLALSPQLDAAFHWLPGMFGGRQSARTFHFLAAASFAFFTFGHVFMVVTTGLFNNMRSMVTGWYREKITSHPASEAVAISAAEAQEPKASAHEATVEPIAQKTDADARPAVEAPAVQLPKVEEPEAQDEPSSKKESVRNEKP